MINHKENHKKALSKPVFVILMACIAIIVVYFANLFLAHLYAKNINNLISNTNTQIAATQDFINEAIDPNNPNAQLQNQDVFYARQMAANKEQVVIIQNALQKAQKTPYALGVGNLKKITVSYFTNLLNYTQQQNNLNSYETSLSKISQDLSLLTQVNDTSVNGLISKFTNYQSVFDIDLSSSGIDLKTQNTQAKQILTNIINSLNNAKIAIDAEDADKFNTEQANLATYSANLKNIIDQNSQTIINTSNTSLSDLSNQIQAQYQQIQDLIAQINNNYFYIPVAQAWNNANYYTSGVQITGSDLVAYPEYLPSYINDYRDNIQEGSYAAGLRYPVIVKTNNDSPVLYRKIGSADNWQLLDDTNTVSGGNLNPITGTSGTASTTRTCTEYKAKTNICLKYEYVVNNYGTTIVQTNAESEATYEYSTQVTFSYVFDHRDYTYTSADGVIQYRIVYNGSYEYFFVSYDSGTTFYLCAATINNQFINIPNQWTADDIQNIKVTADGKELYMHLSGQGKWIKLTEYGQAGGYISEEEFNQAVNGGNCISGSSAPYYMIVNTDKNPSILTTGNVELAEDQYLHINNRNFKIKLKYDNVSNKKWASCIFNCGPNYYVNFSQDLTMNGNSLLSYDTSGVYYANINISADSMYIGQGSTISAIAAGPAPSQYNSPDVANDPGQSEGSWTSGSGGSHGGQGGNGYLHNGGRPMGVAAPSDPESVPRVMPLIIPGGNGAMNTSWYPAWRRMYGGGIIQLTTNNAINNYGVISANGEDSWVAYRGGGAGGTVVINASDLNNQGVITARGGSGIRPPDYQGSGGGGGGTIAILANYTGHNDSPTPYTDENFAYWGNECPNGNNSVIGDSATGLWVGGGGCAWYGRQNQVGKPGWIYYKPKPSYTITLAPFSPDTVGRGGKTTATVVIGAKNDFAGDIYLNGLGQPNDVSYEFVDNSGHTVDHVSLPANGTAQLTLRVATDDLTSIVDHHIWVHGNGTDISTGRKVEKDSSPVTLKIAPFVVTGDVYSGGNIIGNLYITSGSVATAAGAINISGTDYRISNYNTSALQQIQWRVMSQNFENSAINLKNQRGTQYNSTEIPNIGSLTFNLDSITSNGAGTSSPQQYPDGKVWEYSGPLTINATQFNGRGTFIVDGDVEITGNISYPLTGKNSFGLIAINGHNIKIDSNVHNLVGSYYASGNININAPVDGANYNVIMAAKNINFVYAPILTIIYNQAQAQNPPPGFQNLIMPTYSEVSP